MNDYISKEDALKAISHAELGCEYESIKNVPVADVVERKRGKWILKHKKNEWMHDYECSLCGSVILNAPADFEHPINGRIRYCPWCGARMINNE